MNHANVGLASKKLMHYWTCILFRADVFAEFSGQSYVLLYSIEMARQHFVKLNILLHTLPVTSAYVISQAFSPPTSDN